MFDWIYSNLMGWYYSAAFLKRWMFGQVSYTIDKFGSYELHTIINQISDPLITPNKLPTEQLESVSQQIKNLSMINQINNQILNKFTSVVRRNEYKCFAVWFTSQNVKILVISPPKHQRHFDIVHSMAGPNHDWQNTVWLDVTKYPVFNTYRSMIFDLDLIGVPSTHTSPAPTSSTEPTSSTTPVD